MRTGQKAGKGTKNHSNAVGRFIPLLMVAISVCLMSLSCFGGNGVGSTNLALTVLPEARISVTDVSKETRQDLGIDIRWVRVELTLRMPSTGTASLLLHNPAFATNYVINGTDRLDQARATEIVSDVVLQPTKNGRYSVTIGIARSLDDATGSDSNSNAVLELKSSDGSLDVSKAL